MSCGVIIVSIPHSHFSNFKCNIAKKDVKTPNMDVLRKHLLAEGHIAKPVLIEIINEITKTLSKYSIYVP